MAKDEPVNDWAETEHLVEAFDHVVGKWRQVNILELSDEDFRRWVAYQLKCLKDG